MSATVTWRAWSCRVFVTVEQRRCAEDAATLVRALMADVDRAASRFRDDSDLARVNRNAGRLVPVSPLLVRLTRVALGAARATRGAVDPTVGADLVRLGYDIDIDLVRTRAGGAAGQVSNPPERRHHHRSVCIDPTLTRVGVPVGVALDLGATAKAWTADEAARRIHHRFQTAVVVGVGGDLATAGHPVAPWRIDVTETEPQPGSEPVDGVRLGLSRGGLATSSTGSRRWAAADGTAVHHIVDPRTGGSAIGPWRTAAVWADTALAANVASTWALIDGPAATGWIARNGLSARLVAHDDTVTRLGDWPADRPSAGAA